MSDTEMPAAPPLFFAGSDDEDEDELMEPEPQSASSSRNSLFLPSSDDDDLIGDVEGSPENSKKRPIVLDDDSDRDEEFLPFNEPPRASSVPSSIPDRASVPSSPLPRPKIPLENNSPRKKRRVSTPAVVVSSSATSFNATYLGEVVFGNAWSNVSGKGYIKRNESVRILREDQDPTQPSESSKQVNKGKKKETGAKKQMTLAAMMKQPAKASFKKSKVDSIVRLYNSRGFEFGRLPQDVSSWVARLLDLGKFLVLLSFAGFIRTFFNRNR